jgi:dTDP-glucose 4,6-dehydratase
MSGWVKETFEFAPSTPYAVSRAAGDWHLKGLFTNYGFPVIFTRASNVYGARQQLFRIIPKAIISALSGQKLLLHGGGKSVRSFIHINDVSSALISILERGVVGASYHISTRDLISIIDLVEILALSLGKNIKEIIEIGPDRIGNDLAYQLDSDKIRNETGWTDEIDLNSGLQLTVDWVKSNLSSLKTFPSTYEHKR